MRGEVKTDESKACLAERLVEYIESHVDPGIEHSHLEIVRRRMEETRSSGTPLIPGEEGIRRARRVLSQ